MTFRAGILRGVLVAVGAGLMWFIIYGSYALAFWYGVKLIMDDRVLCLEDPDACLARYTPASLLIVREHSNEIDVTDHFLIRFSSQSSWGP